MIEQYRKKIGMDIECLAETIKQTIKNQEFKLEYRTKKENRIRQKLEHYGYNSVFQLRDIYAFRILTPDIPACYNVYSQLIKVFKLVEAKDHLINGKTIKGCSDGKYKALQLTLQQRGCKFEVQITTLEFHQFNESWHERYKNDKYEEEN